MNDIIKEIEAEQLKENIPEFRVGDTVKVYGKIKEGNRERIQVFEGTVLTVPNGIRFADEVLFLGEDFLDKYEAPELHRQNEQI